MGVDLLYEYILMELQFWRVRTRARSLGRQLHRGSVGGSERKICGAEPEGGEGNGRLTSGALACNTGGRGQSCVSVPSGDGLIEESSILFRAPEAKEVVRRDGGSHR